MWMRTRDATRFSKPPALASHLLLMLSIGLIKGAETLQCHCASGTCNPSSGFCLSGCAPGWDGPGCQIGNLAFNRPAYQSSTWTNGGVSYTAGNAVDGKVPGDPNDPLEYCTHTSIDPPAKTEMVYWYVDLGNTRFYISNITIINRKGDASYRLQSFSIMTSNNSENLPSLWTQCASQQNVPSLSSTYACQSFTVARYVAITRGLLVLKDTSYIFDPVLTLCEVYVQGYEYTECSAKDSFGPGCKFTRCQSDVCLERKGVCGYYSECIFGSCQDNSFIPPTCWIEKPSFKNLPIAVEASCDDITIHFNKTDSSGDVPPSQYYVEYVDGNSLDSILATNRTIEIQAADPQSFTWPAVTGFVYRYRLTPRGCWNNNCYDGRSTITMITMAERRELFLEKTGLCWSALLRAVSNRCSPMELFEVSCSGGRLTHTIYSNESVICGLRNGTVYLCTATVTYKNGKAENFTFNLPKIGLRVPSEDSINVHYNKSCDSLRIQLYVDSTVDHLVPWTISYIASDNGVNVSNGDFEYIDETAEIVFEENAWQITDVEFTVTFCNTSSDCAIAKKNVSTKETALSCQPVQDHKSASIDGPLHIDEKSSIIAGTVIGGSLLVIIAAVLLSIYFKRRNAKRHCDTQPLHFDDCNIGTVYAYEGPGAEGMTVDQFAFYTQVHADTITSNFEKLPLTVKLDIAEGSKAENKVKNRFQNIFPYDGNRVIVKAPDGLSDLYVNASYIEGMGFIKNFVAAQGPMSKTVQDFLEMIWQLDSPLVVMLTDFVENAKKKCESYFPIQCGTGISVDVRSVNHRGAHRITDLQLTKNGETKRVHHAHFLTWPDHLVPEQLAEILLFRDEVNTILMNKRGGPPIVHCSAGVGRTGTYLAIHLLLESYKKVGIVNVDGCIRKLREQRMFMVQTKDQYLFIHKAVLHGILTEEFIVPSQDVESHSRSFRTAASHLTKRTEEWQVLQSLAVETAGDFYAALLPENISLNRDASIVAKESKRYLAWLPGQEVERYINAVYASGSRGQRDFLVTQVPLPSTVEDFWSMVWTSGSRCIALLHPIPENDNTCVSFLPADGTEINFGPCQVSCCDTNSSQTGEAFTVKSLEINGPPTGDQKAPISISVFCLNDWSVSSDTPSSLKNFANYVNAVKTWMINNVERPVIVVCLDGATHSGLFVSAMNTVDRFLNLEKAFVFHTVELARMSRPQFVKNEVQYKFLYDVLLHCQAENSTYANT